MTNTTYEKVKQFIERYGMIEEGDLVVSGVSGGADSVCLLHILRRLQRERNFRLLAVHVDHGVRPDSAADAAYVEKLCQRLAVPFFLRQVDMGGYARERGLSPEEAGRQLRYQAFAEVLRGQCPAGVRGKIAVAHNCNDRAETMLFHMFRGSGLKGLASIRPVRGRVIRPLLCAERGEIEGYLEACRLDYCRDSTNEGDAYTRNRIRHHILPYAEKEICRGAVAHMGELAEILSETEQYLDEQTERLYRKYVKEQTGQQDGKCAAGQQDRLSGEEGWDIREKGETRQAGMPVRLCIEGKELLAEPPVMYKRVLLACMERLTPYRKDITGQHIAALAELMTGEGSKEISLPYRIKARREYGRLYLVREEAVPGSREEPGRQGGPAGDRADGEVPVVCEVQPPAEIFLPGEGTFTFTILEKEPGFLEKEQNIPQNRYTKWFDYDKITTSLLLRTRRQGDYLTIDAAMHTKSVKQYMINEKIPKMQRDKMHLLADGAHILWIPGYRISQGYKVDESTGRILQVRFRGGSNGGTNRSVVE